MQYTLDMEPAGPLPKPRTPDRVRKKFWLTSRNAGLVYQISMVTGKRPSIIVNDAISVFAILVKCSQSRGLVLDDADEIAGALIRYLSEKDRHDG